MRLLLLHSTRFRPQRETLVHKSPACAAPAPAALYRPWLPPMGDREAMAGALQPSQQELASPLVGGNVSSDQSPAANVPPLVGDHGHGCRKMAAEALGSDGCDQNAPRALAGAEPILRCSPERTAIATTTVQDDGKSSSSTAMPLTHRSSPASNLSSHGGSSDNAINGVRFEG